MPKCKSCGNWRLPWKISKSGYCADCEMRIESEGKEMGQRTPAPLKLDSDVQLYKQQREEAEQQRIVLREEAEQQRAAQKAEAERQRVADRIIKAMPRPSPGAREALYFKVSYKWDEDGRHARFEAPILDAPEFLVDSLSKPWVAIHLATSGLDEGDSEILSIGAVLIEDGSVKDNFYQLVKPEKSIPTATTNYNGISNAMVANAPSILEVLPDFAEFIAGKNCVAHNPLFVYRFLMATTERLKLPNLYLECADTVEIGERYWPDLHNHKLISLEYLLHGNNIDKPTSIQQAHIIVNIVKAAQIKAKEEIHYRTLDTRILKTISENTPCLQKDLSQLLPDDTPGRITLMVKKLSDEGKVVRVKKGATYILTLPE